MQPAPVHERLNPSHINILYTLGSPAAYTHPDNYTKERPNGIAQFLALLKLVPYTKPDAWVGTCRPLDMLPGYLTHVEGAICAAAMDALQATIRGSPHLRNAVLCSVAAHISGLTDDSPQVRACMLFVC